MLSQRDSAALHALQGHNVQHRRAAAALATTGR